MHLNPLLDDADGVPLVDGETQWHRLIARLADDGNERRSPTTDSVITIFVQWPQPVRAGCYTDLDALDAIDAWVRQLHSLGQINPAVRFTVEDDAGTPVGVLFDPDETLNRWAVLRRGGFLVFTGDKVAVFDERTFHSTYCDPVYTYSQIAESRRRAG